MLEVPVINQDGKEIGKEEIEEELLGSYVRRSLLKEIVIMYEANRRAGKGAAKNRAKIVGSNRKLWRQKGTGRARVGAGKVSQWRGGGHAFPPQPRDFSYCKSRKAKIQALKSALLAKIRKDGLVKILDELSMDAPKTKEVARVIDNAGYSRSCLLVIGDYDKNILLSTRNIPTAKLITSSDLNAYEVLRYHNVLFTKEGFEAMKERVGK